MTYIICCLAATLAIVWFLRYLYKIIRNLQSARTIGLPTLLTPIDSQQLPWLLFSPRHREFLQRILPISVWRHLRVAVFGWEFREKLDPFDYCVGVDAVGRSRSFVLVGPAKLELWTADPELVQHVLTHVGQFEVPGALAIALGQLGPNVMTTNGSQWSRHRRIVSSVLDGRISKMVFEESIAQTGGLLQEVCGSGIGTFQPGETSHLFDMLKKISIHVLLRAGMGESLAWDRSGDQATEDGCSMTQVDSLAVAATNVTGIGIIPTRILLGWPSWLPGHQRCIHAGNAKVEVEKRSQRLLAEERQRLRTQKHDSCSPQEQHATRNIMSRLLQASAQSLGAHERMSDAEVISNLFIFAAAGFETTATTLAYAVVLLARHALWQDWILEEVDELLPQRFDKSTDFEYSALFPRATRILAFMLETLRLYSAVPHVHRETTAPQTVQTSNGPIVVPAQTRIYANCIALHILPAWNDINRQSDPQDLDQLKSSVTTPDSMVFRPSRWINAPGSARTMYLPPKGMFVPWAMGPRVCPGQKMAQVEFVAVMVTMLREHRIEAVPFAEEDFSDVARRLDERLQRSGWVTVLQMDGIFESKPDDELPMRLCRRRP